MPTFEFTSPEGKKYSVDGPPGATQEQAFAVLQQRLGAASAADAPQSAADQIPGGGAAGNRNVGKPSQEADPSLVDRIIGGGETALSLASGATTGMFGLVGGALAGVGKSVADGTFGTQKGVDTAAQAAGEGMDKYTYSPRTAEGQKQTGAWGDLLNSALPVTMMPELAAVGAGAKAGANAVRETARNTAHVADAADAAAAGGKVGSLRDAVKGLPDAVRAPKQAPAMPGVGAAAVSKDGARALLFDKLGIEPTLGQLTRDKEQLGFEREIAKVPEGKAVDDHHANQNAQVQRKFEEFTDQTGAEVNDPRDVGNSVIDALEQKRDALKAEARTAYDTAEAAGEMQEPVDVTSLVSFIKANKGKDKIAPIISMIESELSQNSQQVGGNLDKMTLTPTSKRFVMPLKATEDLRQAINESYEPNTPNHVWGGKAIRVLDAATEDKGGPLYRQARRIYENYSNQFVNRDVVARLLRKKPGTNDRAVVPEQVLQQTLLNSKGKDDVSHIFRVLEAHPANMDPAVVAAGQQAAANLRGAFVGHIRDQMFSNGGANALGETVGSQKKIQNTVTNFDNRGVLKAALGRDGAQTMRDLRDASVYLYTTPEGVGNHSNNAPKIVAAIEQLSKRTPPVLGARKIVDFAADRVRENAINKRIEKALNPKQAVKGPHTHPAPTRPPGATVH